MSSQKEMPPALADSVAHSKTAYKQLGKSGLRVSVPIFGAMSLGDKRWMPWVIEEEEGLPLLKAAWDRGLNTWDTANIYSNGESERIIAKAIKKYELPRHKLVLLTKCFAMVGEEPNIGPQTYFQEMSKSRDYINQGGLSRQAIFTAVNASLARLETDYIDLLQIHRFDKNVPVEETMKALHDLVESGKVRYIGASSMWATEFARMQFVAERNGWTKFVSMQNHYNLLYREEEREMNRFCNETGVGLIPWAPLCRGHLARAPDAFGSTSRSEAEKNKEKPKDHEQTGQGKVDLEIIGRVKELADKKGWKMSQVSLAWINSKVSSPIIGFSKVERIDEAIETADKTLTNEEVKYLEELYEPKSISGHV